MAVTHPQTATRNDFCDAVTADVDADAGAGHLVITDGDGGTVIVTWELADPSFPAASGGQMTLNNIPTGTVAATATAANPTALHFELRDDSSNAVVKGTVKESGGDLTIDNQNIQSGQNVTVVDGTIIYAAAL